MDIETRIKLIRLSEKLEKNKVFSEKLGIKIENKTITRSDFKC